MARLLPCRPRPKSARAVAVPAHCRHVMCVWPSPVCVCVCVTGAQKDTHTTSVRNSGRQGVRVCVCVCYNYDDCLRVQARIIPEQPGARFRNPRAGLGLPPQPQNWGPNDSLAIIIMICATLHLTTPRLVRWVV